MPREKKEIIEEELIFGARKREEQWRKIAMVAASFGVIGCLSAAAVAIFDEDPPPALVPFDPVSGLALPMANVGTISLNEQQAVVASMVFAYVRDRETFNQLDNDLRIKTVLDRSTGSARASLVKMWTAGDEHYPPTVYGKDARMDVEVVSVTPITNDRAQARVVKRLTTPKGVSQGTFLITLAYDWKPQESRGLQELWQNPFGFSVREYSVVAERFAG